MMPSERAFTTFKPACLLPLVVPSQFSETSFAAVGTFVRTDDEMEDMLAAPCLCTRNAHGRMVFIESSAGTPRGCVQSDHERGGGEDSNRVVAKK